MTLSNIFIPLFTFIHFVMLFFAALMGLGSASVGGVVFLTIAVAGMIFYGMGLRLLTRPTNDQQLLKRGYMFMMLGCIPLIPVSFIFGFIPARLLARRHGFLETKTIGKIPQSSVNMVSASATSPLGQTHSYYTRKIWGQIPFWIGVVFVFILLIALMNGAWGAVGKLGTGTFVLLLIGNANRKPRMIITPELVEVRQASFSPTRYIQFSEIASVVDAPQFIITLRSGVVIKFAKFEFSKKTREMFVAQLRSLL